MGRIGSFLFFLHDGLEWAEKTRIHSQHFTLLTPPDATLTRVLLNKDYIKNTTHSGTGSPYWHCVSY